MGKSSPNAGGSSSISQEAVIERLRNALADGHDWATSMVEAIALWTTPLEVFRGRRYNYFVDGEAFDWLLLAERLCQATDGLIPQKERESLLFSGKFPSSFDHSTLKSLLGVEKYRAYLNYYYGVTVEEALQLATELEVHKRHLGNGVRYRDDYTDEAHVKIYGSTRRELLKTFREEIGLPSRRYLSLGESKEFTYWLFKYRLRASDKAKTASDTRKGLHQLERMGEAFSPQAEPLPQP